MNKTLLVLASGILAGGAVVYLFFGQPKPRPEPVVAETVAAAPEPGAVARPRAVAAEAPAHRETVAVASAPKPAQSAWSKLAEKYGPEKTVLSHKIATNLTSVINDGVELANTWAKNTGSSSVAEALTKEILRGATPQLGLTEPQQQQASELLQGVMSRRMAAVNDLVSAMRTEPEQIMDLFLAGDALARGSISRQEYDQSTLPTRTMLRNIAGFVSGQGGAGGLAGLLGSEEAAAQLNAILTPEQQVKLAEITATMTERAQNRRPGRNNAGAAFQNGEVPVMELERLDQSMESVRKMTEAARLMMEGMKGLKDANPKGNSGAS